MLRQVIFFSLLQSKISLSSTMSKSGTSIIITQETDLDDVSTFKSIYDSTIDSITISGINIIKPFIGFNLIKNLIIDSDQITIPAHIFYYNKNIQKVILASTNSIINDYAFANSTISEVVIPDRATVTIGIGSFYGCMFLTAFSFDKCTSIKDYAFSRSNINSIELYSNKMMGKMIFSECYNLQKVQIYYNGYQPDIDNDNFQWFRTFYRCIGLKNVSLIGMNSPIKLPNRMFEETGFFDFTAVGDISLEESPFLNSKLRLINSTGKIMFRYSAFDTCNMLETIISSDFDDVNHCSFENCSSLKNIEIGNKFVSPNCFRNCYQLETVIAVNLVTIYDNAFRNCAKLSTIKLGSPVELVFRYAFFGCKSLTYINLSQNTFIDIYAFAFCTQLTSIGPNYVTVSSFSFYKCEKLISIQIVLNYAPFPYYNHNGYLFGYLHFAFFNCKSLQNVDIKKHKDIDEYAFYGCENLFSFSSDTPISNIDEYAFAFCGLTTFVFNTHCQINDCAFYHSKISSIVINENIEFQKNSMYEIEETFYCNAFGECGPILISLGFNVTMFDPLHFIHAGNLIFNLTNNTFFENISNMIMNSNTLVYYAPTLSDTEYSIPSTVTSIMGGAFSHSKSITKIVNIDVVDNPSFAFCTSIKEVSITAAEISSFAFHNCPNLEKVMFSSTVQSIGNNCFSNCTSLRSINLTNVKKFGNSCFAYCTSFSDVICPISEANIITGYGVFAFTAIRYIDLSKSPKFANSQMFAGCSRLTELIPFVNNFSIFDDMLANTSIEYANFDEVSIGKNAFYGSKLKTLVITDSLLHISPLAFDGLDEFVIIYDGCNQPLYIIGDHEIIEKSTKKLVTTYGRLPSTYVVPSYVKKLGTNSIVSRPKRNDAGEITDFGVTTLIIPGNVDSESNSLDASPYIYNLCYGGSIQSQFLYSESIKRVFVTDIFKSPVWMHYPMELIRFNLHYHGNLRHYCTIDPRYTKVINSECQSSTPYKEFSKGNFYAQPENPEIMIPVQPHKILHQNGSCLFEFNEPIESSITSSPITPTHDHTEKTQDTTSTTSSLSILSTDPDEKAKSSPILIVLFHCLCSFNSYL